MGTWTRRDPTHLIDAGNGHALHDLAWKAGDQIPSFTHMFSLVSCPEYVEIMGATVEGRCLTPVTAVHLLIRRLSVADSDSPQGHGAPEAARGAVRWCDLEAGPHARAHRSVRPIAKEHRQFLEHALGLEREDYLRMRIAHRLGFRAAPV